MGTAAYIKHVRSLLLEFVRSGKTTMYRMHSHSLDTMLILTLRQNLSFAVLDNIIPCPIIGLETRQLDYNVKTMISTMLHVPHQSYLVLRLI